MIDQHDRSPPPLLSRRNSHLWKQIRPFARSGAASADRDSGGFLV